MEQSMQPFGQVVMVRTGDGGERPLSLETDALRAATSRASPTIPLLDRTVTIRLVAAVLRFSPIHCRIPSEWRIPRVEPSDQVADLTGIW